MSAREAHGASEGGAQCQRGGRAVPARGACGASKGVHNASEGVQCQQGDA